MTINQHDWARVTESKYFKADLGRDIPLVIKDWRVEKVTFGDSKEERDALVMTVIEENGRPTNKVWSSGNRALNLMLRNSIELAESEGRNWIKIILRRLDRNNYTLADMNIVQRVVDHGATAGYVRL